MTIFHKLTGEGEDSGIIDAEVSTEFLERIPGGVFRYHADGDLELDYFNDGLIEIYGCNDVEDFRAHVGNSFVGMVHPEDYDRVQKEIDEQIAVGDSDHVKYRILTKGGETRYIEDFGRYVVDSAGTPWFYVTIVDVTDEVLLRRKDIDSLTSVNTREGASLAINEILSMTDGPCTFMVIDVDDFKGINDGFGHPTGDKVLKALASHLSNAVRKDDVVGRIGGDEFIIFAEGLGKGEALNRVVKRMIDTPFVEVAKEGEDGEKKATYPSISIGVVTSPDSNVTLDELYACADRALYEAKEGGKGCACFTCMTEDGPSSDLQVSRTVFGQGDNAVDDSDEEERYTLLVVDDSAMNRALLDDILGDEYDIIEAADGEEAVSLLEENSSDVSLVVLDIMMPKLDGFDVLQIMNDRGWIDDIPVVTISAESSESYMQKAYDLGATDYISRPFNAAVVKRRIANTLMLYAKQRRLLNLIYNQIYESGSNNSLMVSILSHIVEFRNGESGMHVLNIGTITDILLHSLAQKTDKYDLSEADMALIVTASAMHDIGKISIDAEVLNKPGKLTDEEFAHMKQHPAIGDKMLEELPFYQDDPLIKVSREICRWHHERYDGRGYPDGLAGEDIPISAQVVSIADVYDALTSARVYKPPFSHEKALDMITHGECGQFNPLLVECLLDSSERIQEDLAQDYATVMAKRETRNAVLEIQEKLIETELAGHRIKQQVENMASVF